MLMPKRVKHRKQFRGSMAGKAMRGNTISNGDFGIVKKLGGNWLCEGGSVSYDGKYWIATCTYAHSPDGWDKDLYTDAD